MENNPLTLQGFNTVIAGNGAIGSALARAIQALPGSRHVFLLGRSDKPDLVPTEIQQLATDAGDPATSTAAAQTIAERCDRVHLLINTVGVLHSAQQQPEKRLRNLDQDSMLASFQVNAVFPGMLANAFSSLLKHSEPAVFASLSARVGSITDNDMGGWYSYRASKAAHNMLLKTLSREWRVSHRNATVLALHPGTVASRLSEPFIGKNYPNRVLQPDECASALLDVIAKMTPDDSGSFFDWRGEPIPW